MRASEPRELADRDPSERCREVTSRSARGGTIREEGGLLLYAGSHPLPMVVYGAIGWVGTLAEARDRGLGEAKARTASDAGSDRRPGLAELRAEPLSHPIGFAEVGRHGVHVGPEPASVETVPARA